MKTTCLIGLLAGVLLLNACQADMQNAKPVDLSHSFGQPAPGLTPAVFAPGVISLKGHTTGSITFNPDMTELFFQRRKADESHNIYTMKLIDGRWSEPALAPFSTNKEYLDFHPRLNATGDRLYFGSTRPLSENLDAAALEAWKRQRNFEKLNQWYVEKGEQGWGKPQLLLESLLADRWVMCVSPAANGNLYFTSSERDARLADEGIYYVENQGGQYGSVEGLGASINGYGKWIAHPFIDPDEKYLIYDAERTDIAENGDLYVSFNIDGEWTASYPLGPEINTEKGEQGATVSPDGKYLFYIGSGEDEETNYLYWVSTAVIDRWHPDGNPMN